MARLVSRSGDPDDDGVTLRYHYRCPETVIRFSNELCYGGILKMRKPDPQQDLPAMGWVEVMGSAQGGGGSSWRNVAEADEIASWIIERWPGWRRRFGARPAKQIVALITAYTAQAAPLAAEDLGGLSASRDR
jgi:hypothetical protein